MRPHPKKRKAQNKSAVHKKRKAQNKSAVHKNVILEH